jgi:hypothetical protein
MSEPSSNYRHGFWRRRWLRKTANQIAPKSGTEN